MLAEFDKYSFIDVDRIAFMFTRGNQFLIGVEGVGTLEVLPAVYERLVAALMHVRGSYLHDYTDKNSETYRKKISGWKRVEGITKLVSEMQEKVIALEKRQAVKIAKVKALKEGEK